MEVPKATSMQTGRNGVIFYGESQNVQSQNNGPIDPMQDEEFNKMIAENHIVDDFAPQIDEQLNQFNHQHAIEPTPVVEVTPATPDHFASPQYVDKQVNHSPQVQQVQPEKNKYHIMDLFWLINEKICVAGAPVEEGEAKFVILSYNMDFGNLRVVMYDVPDGAIQGTVVFQQSLKNLVVGTVYPSSCYRLLNTDVPEMTCMEQLINNTGEQWQKERPFCQFKKEKNELSGEEYIRMTISDPKTQKAYHFNFVGWQKDVLLEACQFAYTEGFKLHGNNIIRNR